MKSIIFTCFMLAACCCFGQVKTKIFRDAIPASFAPTARKTMPVKKISAPAEFKRLLKEPYKDDNKAEYKNKFAIPVVSNINLLTDGSVTEEKGYILYNLSIDAESALNTSVRFNNFQLSPNAILQIYTKQELTDSITATENTLNKIWFTRVYQGSQLNFLLKVPVAERGKTSLLIDRVNFGYRKMGSEFYGNPGVSGDCNRNVACAEGIGWEAERSSVAIIIGNGIEFGTGALVMNTCGTNIPYFLTAHHLLDGGIDPTDWVFQFKTWSTQCLSNTGWVETFQYNGSQLLATDFFFDFLLLRLNQTPSFRSGITYSGWDRSGIPATSATAIHHPMGDLMKISTDQDPVTAIPWIGPGDNDATIDHWRATFNTGIVQHGSSGSPLYDQNHRVVGQLHGNQNNICAVGDNNCFCTVQIPSIGEYGRFDLAWTGRGTNSTRLSNWLDPGNTGAMTTNTTDIIFLPSPTATLSISGPTHFCSGSMPYSLSGLPPGMPVTWTSSDIGVATVVGNGATATVTKVTGGTVTITATINRPPNCGTTNNTATYVVSVGGVSPVDINIYLTNGDPEHLDCTSLFTAAATFPATAGVTGYQWTINPEWTIISNPNNPTVNFGPNIASQNGWIALALQNECGFGGSQALFMRMDCNFGWGFSVSPNPASNYLNVAILEENAKAAKTAKSPENVSFALYNFYTNQVVKEWKGSGTQRQHRLNIAGITKGNYILVVKQGTHKESKQVIIR